MNTLNEQLIEACQKGDIHTARSLLQQGADPNFRYKNGKTPTIIAAEYGQIDIIDLLVQHGAKPYLIDHHVRTALHYAAQNQQHQTAQYLITQLQFDPNIRDDDGNTPFLIAAERNDINMLKLLVQLGANPHITNKVGRNALYYAVKNQRHDITQYLLTQLHLDPDNQDRTGEAPFLIAALNGDIHTLQLLHQHGAYPHIQDHHGQNALHLATMFKRYQAVQYLITHLKLNPNAQDHDGTTPLMIAASKGDIKMLRRLIQLGADPTITDDFGRNILYCVTELNPYKTTQYLIIQLQLDPNTRDRYGITPLMIAASKGDIKMLRRLIQLGANPYAIDHDGRTALHHAVEREKHNIAQYLITHLHLDPNTQDHHGNTPLLIAIERRYTLIAKKLIQLGANPHIPNHQGQTPSSVANRYKIPLEKPQPSTITL